MTTLSSGFICRGARRGPASHLHGFLAVAAWSAALTWGWGALPFIAQAQTTWQQSQFMIGTWVDPGSQAPVLDTPGMTALYRQARGAHINLLTDTPRFNGAFAPASPVFAPQYPRLDATSLAGGRTLLTDPHFTGFANYTGTYDDNIAQTVLAMYAGMPSSRNQALEGYLLWDEPSDQYPATMIFLKAWAAKMHADDGARADGRKRAVYVNVDAGRAALRPGFLDTLLVDPDISRRPDVASTDPYPFTTSSSGPRFFGQYFRAFKGLRAALGGRPFWAVSQADSAIISPVGANCGPGPGLEYSVNPDVNVLRYVAFLPVAAGAKGILWYTYHHSPECTSPQACRGEVVHETGRIGTCKLEWLRTINHYLTDVVGPVVMASTHVGIFHQTTATSDVYCNHPDIEAADLVSANPTLCPASNLGNSLFTLGVFRPNADPSSYYLLVANKSLTPKTGTIALRQSWAIAAAPSVVGYVGGSAYTPVGTGSSFTVTLQGGEGRLYHLTPASTPDFAMTSPSGAFVQWLPGQSRTIRWSPTSGAVDVLLAADLDETRTGLVSPMVTLAAGVSGTSATAVMPDVLTLRGRIVLKSTGADGVLRQVVGTPVVRTVAGTTPLQSWDLGDIDCSLDFDLDPRSNGGVEAVYRNCGTTPVHATYAGGAWTEGGTYALAHTVTGLQLVRDDADRPHVLFSGRGGPFGEVGVIDQVDNSGWEEYVVDAPYPRGEIAAARGSAGQAYVAYATGTADGHELRISQYGGILLFMAYGGSRLATGPSSLSMAVDAAGNPWLAFLEGTLPSTTLKVVKYTATTEVSYLSVAGAFSAVSLALDATGNPRIAYSQGADASGARTLVYRAYSNGAWGAPQTVDATPTTIRGLSLALWQGQPRIAYVGNGVAKIAEWTSPTWSRSALSVPDEADAPIRLAYGAAGERWAGFQNRTLNRFRVIGPPAQAPGAPPCTDCDPPPVQFSAVLRSQNPTRIGQALSLEIQLPRSTSVEMSLIDVQGRVAAAKSFGSYASGTHRIVWAPGKVSPGVYFLRQNTSSGWSATQRVLMIP